MDYFVSSDEVGVFYDNPHEKLARDSDITQEDELAKVIENTFSNKLFREDTILAGKNISLQKNWKDIARDYNKLYSSL